MKRRMVFLGLALFLAGALVASACSSPAPTAKPTVAPTSAAMPTPTALAASAAATPTPHPQVKVPAVTADMGSASYVLTAGLEALFAKEHPWFNLSAAEGPGSTADVFNMLTDPTWKDRIAITSTIDYALAQQGLGPFQGKAYPQAKDVVKVLANSAFAPIGLYTLDPSIKTEKDLAGKRVALGQPGQTAWSVVQTLVFTQLEPELNVKLEYLGSTQATEALIEGTADAACSVESASADFSIVSDTAPTQQLLGSRKTPHWISWSDTAIQRAKDLGLDLNPVQVPANTFPGDQPEPIWNFVNTVAWSADKDFPENLAYEFTKFLIAHSGELASNVALAKVIAKPEALCAGWNASDLHPGALRAYQEAGLMPK